MKLSEYVFYRDYNDKTFVVDTAQHRSFRFDMPVALLFDLFAKDTSHAEAIQCLHSRFPNTDYAELSKNAEQMEAFLKRNGMLTEVGGTVGRKQSDTKPDMQYFQTYTIRNKLLFSASLELTYRCPEKCIHCFLEPRSFADSYEQLQKAELSTNEVKGILDRLADLNVMCVTFTGGEPFVRSDIFEILEHAAKRRLVTDVFSNGILLTEEAISRLARLPLNCFHCSIYSHIPQKHDAITGVPGSFNKTVRTIRALSEAGIYINIKFVLMEQNKDDFSQVVALAKSFGATIGLIPHVSPAKTGNCTLHNLNVHDDAALKRILRNWNEVIHVKTLPGLFEETLPVCKAGRNHISVNPYGVVTPCNAFEYPVGDLRTSTLDAIWNHSEALQKWQQTTAKDRTDCKDCRYMPFCAFCPGNALKETGRVFGKAEETCRQAKIQYELSKENSN